MGSQQGHYRGPIGPDGKKPILSASLTGVASRMSTAASGAPRHGPAAATQGTSPARAQPSPAPADGAARRVQCPATTLDEVKPPVDQDGFTLVTSPGKGKARWGAATAAPKMGGPTAADGSAGTSGEPEGAAAAVSPEPALGDDGGTGDQTGGDGDTFQDAEEGTPTAEDLKAQMERDRQTVVLLTQRGYHAGHPLVDEAERQAAASKAAWQGARPGAAVTRRLLWAEQALARARKGQARMEQLLEDLDQEYQAERDARMRRLQELRARTREREIKLAEISREAAQEFRAAEGGGEGTDGTLLEAVDTIEGPLRDAVSEALDSAPAGSALRTRLQGALGTLDSLRGLVEKAARPAWTDFYDLADGEGEQWDEGPHQDAWCTQRWRGWGDGDDGWGATSRWMDDGQYEDGDGVDEMDTGEVQAPASYQAASSAECEPLVRASRRRRIDGEDPNGLPGRLADGHDQAAEDHQNVARRQADANDAAATAVEVVPAPPTPVAADMVVERRKQEVWDLAQDQGIQITVAEIAGMSGAELEAWASANLL